MNREIGSIDFGQWMRQKRKEKKWNQKQLGAHANCHGNSIGRWERGEAYPTLDEAEQIAKVFGAELVVREHGTD